MNDLREDLKVLLSSNPLSLIMYPAGIVLIFIYPALYLIQCITYNSVIYDIQPIAYVLYVFGILCCIADDRDWAVGTAFGIKAFGNLISVCRYFNVASFLYLLVYGAAAGVLIYFYVVKHRGSQPGDMRSAGQPRYQSPVEITHCPGCGKLIEDDGQFCPFCGTAYGQQGSFGQPISGGHRDNQSGGRGISFGSAPHVVEYSGPYGEVALFSSAILTLVFSVLMTASILMNIIVRHSLITVIAQIPVIIICIACWILYATSSGGNLTTTGFSLINGALIAEMVISFIPCVLGFVAGLFVLVKGGSDFALAGLIIMIACALLIFVFWLYWGGFRATTTSARSMVRGETGEWKTSLFSIIVLIISAAWNLISLLMSIGSESLVSSWLDSALSDLTLLAGSGFMEDALFDYLQPLLNGNHRGIMIISSLLAIAVNVCAVVILLQIRSRNKMHNYNA